MTILHRIASIARWIVRRDRAERDLSDELEAFVHMAAADKMRDGAAPDEARRLAVLHLGGVEQAKERIRSGRRGASLDDIGRDVRYAFRMLVRNGGFTIVVVLTLAVGIGSSSTIVSLINARVLRPLPVADPQELYIAQAIEPREVEQRFSSPVVERAAELLGGGAQIAANGVSTSTLRLIMRGRQPGIRSAP